MAKSNYFISSWSGGKDSCLALYYAMQSGLKPHSLINMLTDNPGQTLKEKVVSLQASALNLPVKICKTTWNDYELNFISTLKKIKDPKVNACVFGDIDLEAHREWTNKVCQTVGLSALSPLWQKDRHELLSDFINLGFKAIISTLDSTKLDTSFLGKEITRNLIHELEQTGIDPCGENGEYHTVVLDGPIFNRPLSVQQSGLLKNGKYSYLNFNVTAE